MVRDGPGVLRSVLFLNSNDFSELGEAAVGLLLDLMTYSSQNTVYIISLRVGPIIENLVGVQK